MGEVKDAKPELQFPLEWTYRVVMEAAQPEQEEALLSLFAAHGLPGVRIVPSRQSEQGRYRSYGIQVLFADRIQMEAIDAALAALPGVKFVL